MKIRFLYLERLPLPEISPWQSGKDQGQNFEGVKKPSSTTEPFSKIPNSSGRTHIISIE